jgi:endonuclease G
VQHFRVAIANIEGRTGLKFSDEIRQADTIAQAGQPNVGEAAVLVRDFSDIKL